MKFLFIFIVFWSGCLLSADMDIIEDVKDDGIVGIQTTSICKHGEPKYYTGTGFYVTYKEKVYLVTAGHNIIDKNHAIKSTMSDVAIIQTDYVGKTFVLSAKSKKGMKIQAIGYVPTGNKGKFVLSKLNGVITDNNHKDHDFKGGVLIEANVKGEPGMSGPLINRKTGDVLGLIHGYCSNKEVFVPSSRIIAFIEEIRNRKVIK